MAKKANISHACICKHLVVYNVHRGVASVRNGAVLSADDADAMMQREFGV